MKRRFMLLVLLIAILSVGCVCAADTDVTDSSDIGESFDIDDSISQDLASEHFTGERPFMELPRGYEKKLEYNNDPEHKNFIGNGSLFSNDTELPSDENLNGSFVSNGTDLSGDDKNDKGNQSDIPGPKINPNENVTINGPKIDIKGPSGNGPKLDIKGPKVPKGTLYDLQEEIDKLPAGKTLYLYRDYFPYISAYMVQITKDLTIDGLGHTIDCEKVQYTGVFQIKSGNVTLKNIKIINSQNPYYGDGTVSITGSAQCTLINCMFYNNWANGDGSVIWNKVNKPLTIIKCTFGNNEAGHCGGVVWAEGVVNVINSTFDSNKAYLKGGAIYSVNDVNIFNSSFKSHQATKSFHKCFGGTVCSEGNVYAVNSTFIGSLVVDFGGAICAEKDVILENCLLESNKAMEKGKRHYSFGGPVFSNGTVYATNSTFNNNSVCGDGGAICCQWCNP